MHGTSHFSYTQVSSLLDINAKLRRIQSFLCKFVCELFLVFMINVQVTKEEMVFDLYNIVSEVFPYNYRFCMVYLEH